MARFILTVGRDFDLGMGQGLLGKCLWFPKNIVFAQGLLWEKVHFNVISIYFCGLCIDWDQLNCS